DAKFCDCITSPWACQSDKLDCADSESLSPGRWGSGPRSSQNRREFRRDEATGLLEPSPGSVRQRLVSAQMDSEILVRLRCEITDHCRPGGSGHCPRRPNPDVADPSRRPAPDLVH